ncbi:sugar phosphate nucleotidyltransferase [Marinimicrococcus flavescens]|uniref:Sugar phosphate nucleotidyltransferase n=1 Tax=Marinimicrococcus flavescens TaxID=3031815 RepID=A0AAP3XR95_9PROT|nr:sugar phosphate nucleotidyltransferase [Marinimicrococcus flavescens]
MRSPAPADVPVFILCGGLGTRLGDVTRNLPKPMIDVGGRPLLLHVMGCYGRWGFRRFVLCTGWRGEIISQYFLNFSGIAQDFTLETRSREVIFHQSVPMPDWEITIARTGDAAQTGARIARAAARYLGDAEHFAVTYGDGVTDADLGAELNFHAGHGRLATSLGVHGRSQFGHLELREDGAAGFLEKPLLDGRWISGGFFLFRRAFLDHLSTGDACVLEGEPLRRLSELGELRMYPYGGFWSCVDTLRDREEMHALWESGAAPWRGAE